MSLTRKWTALAIVAALVVAAGGWMLVISPAYAQASELEEQADSQAAANQQLQVTIAQLRQEAQHLESQQKRLQELDQRIPEKMELADLIRKIAQTVRRRGASTTGFTPSEPQALQSEAGATTANSSSSESATQAQGAESQDKARPSEGEASSGRALFMVPVTLIIQGNFQQLENVLKDFESYQRVFLITSTAISVVNEANDATTPQGQQLSLTVTGRVFTRTNEFTEAVATAQSATTTGSTSSTQKGLG